MIFQRIIEPSSSELRQSKKKTHIVLQWRQYRYDVISVCTEGLVSQLRKCQKSQERDIVRRAMKDSLITDQ